MLPIFLLSSSLIETNTIGLNEMIRGDGVGLSTCLDNVIETKNAEDSTGVDGIFIRGGVNFDVALA